MSAELRENVAGTTKPHLENWTDIISDTVILQNIVGFRLEFDSQPV